MKNGRGTMSILAAVFLCLGGGLAGAENADLTLFQVEEPAMGTLFTLRFYASDETTAERASQRVAARIHELNAIFSDYYGDSEVLRFCREPSGKRVKLSAELFDILSRAQKIAENTDGAFDVTIGPLIRQWRLSRRDGSLPSPAKLDEAFALTGYEKLKLHDDGTASLALENMRIDLGGIAKGYAADEALKILENLGIDRALVAASGDIAASGPPPGEPGWKVGLTRLLSPHEPDVFIHLKNAAVSTSGDTRQFVVIDGIRYSHILDPDTGLGLTERRSVNVIADNATLTDALATALSVTAFDKEIAKAYPDVAFRIVEEDGRIQYGGGFKKRVRP